MDSETRWLDHLIEANRQFCDRVKKEALPVKRTPGSVAVITCMDPRVNLEAIGVSQFGPKGENDSPVRIIRTIGGMSEARSLVIGTFLAGIREYAILMHTDCGCCLAYSKIDTIVENLKKRLSPSKLEQLQI